MTAGRPRTPYTLHFLPAAARQLGKLPADVQSQVKDAVERLRTDRRPSGGRKLAGAEHTWRIKVGRDYRVSYLVDDQARTVTVTEVAHRREAYRR